MVYGLGCFKIIRVTDQEIALCVEKVLMVKMETENEDPREGCQFFYRDL